MINCTQSAEEAYKSRVEKFEYSIVVDKMDFFIRIGVDWDSIAYDAEELIEKSIAAKMAGFKLSKEEVSYEWKRKIWLEEMDLNRFFDDIGEIHFKKQMNRYLSDEDIKHRYYEFFCKVFDAAMGYLEDEKKSDTTEDDEPDIPSREDFYRMTHQGTDELSDEEIDDLLGDDEEQTKEEN